MEEQLTMSNRDIDKLKAISIVINGRITWDQAGEQLQLCPRQIGYLCARARKEGTAGFCTACVVNHRITSLRRVYWTGRFVRGLWSPRKHGP